METPRVRVFKHKMNRNPNFGFSRGFLHADFDNFLSTVGPRSQLESCSTMNLVCPLRISASLGQRNDLWKEFSENRSVLATRSCTGNCTIKKCDFGKVSNWKVVGNELI